MISQVQSMLSDPHDIKLLTDEQKLKVDSSIEEQLQKLESLLDKEL